MIDDDIRRRLLEVSDTEPPGHYVYRLMHPRRTHHERSAQ